MQHQGSAATFTDSALTFQYLQIVETPKQCLHGTNVKLKIDGIKTQVHLCGKISEYGKHL